MWQYTNEGSVPGIGGNVDLDIGYIDYPGIIRRAGLNHLSETAPPPAPPSAPTYITYTIQPGDTLSEIAGKIRNNRLFSFRSERYFRSQSYLRRKYTPHSTRREFCFGLLHHSAGRHIKRNCRKIRNDRRFSFCLERYF